MTHSRAIGRATGARRWSECLPPSPDRFPIPIHLDRHQSLAVQIEELFAVASPHWLGATVGRNLLLASGAQKPLRLHLPETEVFDAAGIQHKTGYLAGLIPLEMKIAVGSFKVVHKRRLEFLRFGL